MYEVLMQIVSMGSAVVLAAAALFVFLELRQVRHLLEEFVFRDPSTGPPDDYCRGYAIFIWKDGNWILEADLSGAGSRATKPTLEGTYEGQVVKTVSVKE